MVKSRSFREHNFLHIYCTNGPRARIAIEFLVIIICCGCRSEFGVLGVVEVLKLGCSVAGVLRVGRGGLLKVCEWGAGICSSSEVGASGCLKF